MITSSLPVLQNNFVKLVPLQVSDFEALYKVASDPLIWEQHPNKDRYKKEVFETFFKGALESKGAYIIYDLNTENAIGSSRFYDYNSDAKSIAVGYTFYARKYWGGTYNPAVKQLMLKHAFSFVDRINFHVGSNNIRSQKAIEKLGAIKVNELDLAYYGEEPKLNFIYEISKINFIA